DLMEQGERIYSAAYIMPSPSFGSTRKHRNHLLLLAYMMRDGAPRKVERVRSLRAVFELLRGFPSLGYFLAFQFTVVINYSTMANSTGMAFVGAGPGPGDGIRKCFTNTGGLSEAGLLEAVAAIADDEFARLGLNFSPLWGRPLQLIDYQNLFCEV